MMTALNALLIESGAELAKWTPTYVEVQGHNYTVLTGYEGPDRRCFWCGGELKGKLKRYCRGHMMLYYRHFKWGPASQWALERAGYRCENCPSHGRLQVHHIVPLVGPRDFSVFNLPWNLVVLCTVCHVEIHRILRGTVAYNPDPWVRARLVGQGVMALV